MRRNHKKAAKIHTYRMERSDGSRADGNPLNHRSNSEWRKYIDIRIRCERSRALGYRCFACLACLCAPRDGRKAGDNRSGGERDANALQMMRMPNEFMFRSFRSPGNEWCKRIFPPRFLSQSMIKIETFFADGKYYCV